MVRFVTGLCEAPFFPGITLMTSSWYTKDENPMRMAIWHAGNTISNIISGFLAAGILHHMGGVAGLYSWQWFFIIEGAVSIAVGIAAYFILPDWPENTRWLTEQEREMAQYRVLLSNGGKEEQVGGTWDGLKSAVVDPFTWMFCGMHFSLINAQSFKDFFPSVRKSILVISHFTHANRRSDHQDLRLLGTQHLPRASSALRPSLCLRLCPRLELRQIQRIMLPHRSADHRFRSRNLSHDLHP